MLDPKRFVWFRFLENGWVLQEKWLSKHLRKKKKKKPTTVNVNIN
jgi:hypothetical protein